MIKALIKLLLEASCFVLLIAVLPVMAEASPSLKTFSHRSPQFTSNKSPLLITSTLYLPTIFSSNTAPFGYGVQPDPRGNTITNISHIKTMGLDWVKFQMAWKDVELSPGSYTWDIWDEVIGAYNANEIKVMLSIPKAPDWARPSDDDKAVDGFPANPATYTTFVTQVTNRYRGKVQAIEIWQEQNLWYAVGGRGHINAATYVQLLRPAYQAIKAVDPNIMVISGGMTAAGNVSDLATDDIDYLNQMYTNGAKGYFDAVGAHPSGYNCPALADWRIFEDPMAVFRNPFDHRHHSWCFLGTMEGYRNVMIANGDDSKKIIPTEFGWAVSNDPFSGYGYARDNTYQEQAQWIVEAYQWGKSQGWVGPMILWNLDYGVTAAGTELAYFSLLTSGGVVPAYTAITTMPK